MIGGTMDDTQRQAMRQISYGFNKAMLDCKHAFERFNEAYLRSQNEERRQRELNRLRNRSLR
jgi:hypothetical protein